jgi:hypothetical protein
MLYSDHVEELEMRKDGLNQFGDEKAYRKQIKVTEWKWQCSLCGHIMPLADNPPVRCSNRGGCGRMLHDEAESAKHSLPKH